jgi:hypothetical protein
MDAGFQCHKTAAVGDKIKWPVCRSAYTRLFKSGRKCNGVHVIESSGKMVGVVTQSAVFNIL